MSAWSDREDFDYNFLIVTGGLYLAYKKTSVDPNLLMSLKNRHEKLHARIKRRDPTIKVLTLKELEHKPCFVVTAATGSDCHPVVIELRHFREQHLVTSAAGRVAGRIYNLIGPVLARVIGAHWLLQKAAIAPIQRLSDYYLKERTGDNKTLALSIRTR